MYLSTVCPSELKPAACWCAWCTSTGGGPEEELLRRSQRKEARLGVQQASMAAKGATRKPRAAPLQDATNRAAQRRMSNSELASVGNPMPPPAASRLAAKRCKQQHLDDDLDLLQDVVMETQLEHA